MATTNIPRRPASSGPTSPPSKTKGSGNRRKPPKKRGFWYAVRTFFTAISVLILVAIITAMVGVYVTLQNSPKNLVITFNPPGRTQIYSSDGTLLARMFEENRQVVPIEKVPKNLQNATVDFEDKRFFTHSGVDIIGIGRSLWKNLRSGDIHGQGGSTITQQLARNLGVDGLTTKKSIQRKFHEWIVANQLEHTYTKQEILEMYLNDVNYGSGAYGVQAAAQTYFGKNVQDLDLAQSALLAGLPNRPSYYSPYKDKKAAEGQRTRVLQQMLEAGHITPKQFDQANTEKIRLPFAKPPPQGSQLFHAPFFVNYVIDLMKHKYGEDYLMRGNLNVYTTLNWGMQQAAEEAVQEGINNVSERGPNQGCLVALDPKTGEIKAMVGGMDYKKSNFNIVTQAHRQPGSLFKLVVYSAAIDSGLVNEDTRVYDAPETFETGGKSWTPKDDSGYSYRRVDLREAMAYSINVPAVKVLHELGAQTAIRYARVMGISSPLDPVLSLALGSSGVTPLEMTSAYSTIAAGGSHPVPNAFTRLADSDNNTIEDDPPMLETHVLNSDTVKQIDDMLRAVVTDPRGTGAGANSIDNAHGKTGTTQGHKDVWFIGYTPDLVCGVWAGHPLHNKKTGTDSYGQEMAGNAWGSTVCVPIWRNFMSHALPIFRAAKAKEASRAKVVKKVAVVSPASANTDGSDNSDITDTTSTSRRHTRRHASAQGTASATISNDGNTVTVNVDNETGLLAPANSANSHTETYAKGTEPTVMAPSYDHSGGSADTNTGSDISNTLPGDPPEQTSRPSPTPRVHTVQNTSNNSGDSGTSTNAPARPVRHHETQQTVTVLINPDDGLLATRWTPETVEKTYIKGEEPHRHSTMYGPPPGEH